MTASNYLATLAKVANGIANSSVASFKSAFHAKIRTKPSQGLLA
jgi:hypothetical protein